MGRIKSFYNFISNPNTVITVGIIGIMGTFYGIYENGKSNPPELIKKEIKLEKAIGTLSNLPEGVMETLSPGFSVYVKDEIDGLKERKYHLTKEEGYKEAREEYKEQESRREKRGFSLGLVSIGLEVLVGGAWWHKRKRRFENAED